MAVNIPGLLSVLLFYIIILAIGLYAARKTKNSNNEDFMLAGRNIGVIMGICTLTAAWFGGGFVNGIADGVYEGGLIWCQAPLGFSISLSFGGYFFAYRMRSQGYVTMIDPFQQKYGSKIGGLLILSPLVAEVVWSAATLVSLGSILVVILDLDYVIAIIISACVSITFTFMGGLYSVACTDVAQMIFIVVGIGIAMPFSFSHNAVMDLSTNTSSWIGELNPAESGIYIDTFLLFILGGIPWQIYFQRVLSCKTPKIAQTMSYVATVGSLILSLPPLIMGIVAKGTDWNSTEYGKTLNSELSGENSKFVLPMTLQYLCPSYISFFSLGAVSAAVMASSGPDILSLGGIFTRNIYRAMFRQKASDRELLWTMRISILVIGVLAALLAIVLRSIYLMFVLATDLVYVMVFPQLTCLIYFPGTNAYGSICGWVAGLCLRLAGGDSYIQLPALIKYPWYDSSKHLQLFPFKTFSMLLSLFVILSVSYGTKSLFENGVLRTNLDILKCVVKTDKKSGLFGSSIIDNSNQQKTEILVESHESKSQSSVSDRHIRECTKM